MVYYRKYRPQTIADLDSPTIRETLTAVLSSQNVPHSFLFTGPKGLGKTSTARIVAKVLNCTNKKGVEPCGECDQCLSITNGTNIDVLEIDGASNRGIDEIRELRDRVKLAPSSATKKVYIIDEVHMLTTEAFNALLKTIEEPPAHVVFIFCTTEPQKVPDTIVSRCFHVTFAKATEAELIHSLERIAKAEKIAVTPDALSLIAHLADGGFRDGAKLFEEMVALSKGEEITKAFVEEKTKTGNIGAELGDFLTALSQKDAKKALGVIEQIVAQGTDIRYVTSELLEKLHGMFLSQVGLGENTQSHVFTMGEISSLVSLCEDAYLKSKTAIIAQLPLELAAAAWCLQDGGQTTDNSPISSFSSKNTLDTMLKKERNLKVQAVLRKEPPQPVVKKTAVDDGVVQHNISGHGDAHTQLMENLIYKVKSYNHSVAGVLRGCNVRGIDDTKVVFETAYKFHKEKLDEAKTKDVLEKALREITGKQIQILIELKQ